MQDIVHGLMAFISWCIANWQIIAAIIVAATIWKLYKMWKRQRASQWKPSSHEPEYCGCGLSYGHRGKHRG